MTEKYRISYTPEAYRDLADIYSYIAFTLKEKHTALQSSQAHPAGNFFSAHIP